MTIAPELVTLTWERFVAVLAEAMPGPCTAALVPDTRIVERAPGMIERSALLGIIARLGRGLPDDLVRSIETFGEAFEWAATKWAGEAFPVGEVSPEVFANLPAARVVLSTLEPHHLPLLFRASVDPVEGYRWRFRGTTPSFADFTARLHDGVLCSFAVVDAATGVPHGWVVAYNARFDAAHVYLGFVRFPGVSGSGEMTEGLFLMVDHLFRTWSFRKIYAEVPEFNWIELVGPSDEEFLFPIEGRLRGHEYHDGQWWDLLTVAVWRERWEEIAGVWRPFLTPTARRVKGATGPTS